MPQLAAGWHHFHLPLPLLLHPPRFSRATRWPLSPEFIPNRAGAFLFIATMEPPSLLLSLSVVCLAAGCAAAITEPPTRVDLFVAGQPSGGISYPCYRQPIIVEAEAAPSLTILAFGEGKSLGLLGRNPVPTRMNGLVCPSPRRPGFPFTRSRCHSKLVCLD